MVALGASPAQILHVKTPLGKSMAENESIESEDHEDSELLEKAKKHFALCEEFYNTEYERGEDDLEFLLGKQWFDADISKRQLDGRPCLTENRVLAFAHQVINDIRQSRPAINIIPVDNNSDVETAKILRGIIRNIEVQSSADNVYDTGAWNALSTGYGWIRVNTKYASNDSFDQELELIRIPDFQSVMIDPNSKQMDGSDADYGFVFEDISREAFEDLYPDADPISFNDKNNRNWCNENTVRVCEYFYKEYEDKDIYLLPDGTVTDEKTKGFVDKRTVRIPKVKWCKLTSKEILEKTDWLGEYIPLVPVYGEEFWVEGKRRCYSLVSQAKDSQRRFNYWLTATTELIALAPKAPFIGVTGQFATDGKRWARANNETFPYLEYDPVEMPNGQLASAPQRQALLWGLLLCSKR